MITKNYLKRVRTISIVLYLIAACSLVIFVYSLPEPVFDYVRSDMKLMICFMVSQIALMLSNIFLDTTVENIKKGF